ncbi:MAG: helix-hairpin-helix domain-containing protein, partial [Planctomycetota bacterium]
DDVKSLTKLKGVGKKTAEQILLDLRDKAPAWQDAHELESTGATQGSAEPALDDNLQDAIAALQSVGYSPKDVEKAVRKAAEDHDPNDLQKLVRAALRS